MQQDGYTTIEPPRGRLEDLLAQANLLLAQLVVFHRSNNPHHSAQQQRRIAELHGRLDVVERQLRLYATEFGIDHNATLGQIRRSLAAIVSHS